MEKTFNAENTTERTLKVKDKKAGRIIFVLLDADDKKLASVYATPYNAHIFGRESADKNLLLSPDERLYCIMEALKTVPR